MEPTTAIQPNVPKRVNIFVLTLLGLLSGVATSLVFYFNIGFGIDSGGPKYDVTQMSLGAIGSYIPGIIFGFVLALYFLFRRSFSFSQLLKSILFIPSSCIIWFLAVKVGVYSINFAGFLLFYAAIPGFFVSGIVGGILLLVVFSVLLEPLSTKKLAKYAGLLGLIGVAGFWSITSPLTISPFQTNLFPLFILWQGAFAWSIGRILNQQETSPVIVPPIPYQNTPTVNQTSISLTSTTHSLILVILIILVILSFGGYIAFTNLKVTQTKDVVVTKVRWIEDFYTKNARYPDPNEFYAQYPKQKGDIGVYTSNPMRGAAEYQLIYYIGRDQYSVFPCHRWENIISGRIEWPYIFSKTSLQGYIYPNFEKGEVLITNGRGSGSGSIRLLSGLSKPRVLKMIGQTVYITNGDDVMTYDYDPIRWQLINPKVVGKVPTSCPDSFFGGGARGYANQYPEANFYNIPYLGSYNTKDVVDIKYPTYSPK